jgi:protein subunit release factor B
MPLTRNKTDFPSFTYNNRNKITCTCKARFVSRQLSSITIDENDIEEKFVKGGGKGGQKINKTNSKVQLLHIPTGLTQ